MEEKIETQRQTPSSNEIPNGKIPTKTQKRAGNKCLGWLWAFKFRLTLFKLE